MPFETTFQQGGLLCETERSMHFCLSEKTPRALFFFFFFFFFFIPHVHTLKERKKENENSLFPFEYYFPSLPFHYLRNKRERENLLHCRWYHFRVLSHHPSLNERTNEYERGRESRRRHRRQVWAFLIR